MVSAKQEFEPGRILWTVDGVPIDGRKPADLDECLVLGCDNQRAPDSCFCVERHGKKTD